MNTRQVHDENQNKLYRTAVAGARLHRSAGGVSWDPVPTQHWVNRRRYRARSAEFDMVFKIRGVAGAGAEGEGHGNYECCRSEQKRKQTPLNE